MDDAHYPTLRAVLASALISTALTLPVSGALAQMSDMKKMPGMNDSKMSDTKKKKNCGRNRHNHGPECSKPQDHIRSWSDPCHRLAGNEDGIRGRFFG
jgi:hypothetical protein